MWSNWEYCRPLMCVCCAFGLESHVSLLLHPGNFIPSKCHIWLLKDRQCNDVIDLDVYITVLSLMFISVSESQIVDSCECHSPRFGVHAVRSQWCLDMSPLIATSLVLLQSCEFVISCDMMRQKCSYNLASFYCCLMSGCCCCTGWNDGLFQQSDEDGWFSRARRRTNYLLSSQSRQKLCLPWGMCTSSVTFKMYEC